MTTANTEVTTKLTRSQILFNTMRANRRRGATVQQLAEATGLKIAYMGSYLAELKRVHGAVVVYNKATKRYQVTNSKEVRKALNS